MNDSAFNYDVFLSLSAKDKQVVRASSLSASNGKRAGVRCRKYYFAGGQVEIAAELVHELDAQLLQKEKKIKALGTGRAAKWEKLGN